MSDYARGQVMSLLAGLRDGCQLTRVLAALGVVLLLGAPLSAQDCLPPGSEDRQTQPVCPVAPWVDVSPGSTSVMQPAVRVTAKGSDHLVDGDTSAFKVLLNGVNVTRQWQYSSELSGSGTGRMKSFTIRGEVPLSETSGPQTVIVEHCDLQVCEADTAVYRLRRTGVAVTPDAGLQTVGAAATRSVAFTVSNQGSEEETFTLAGSCRESGGAALSSCSLSAGSVRLAAGASAAVNVTFPAQTGQVVSLALRAEQQGAPGVRDAGTVEVTVRGGVGSSPSALQMALVDLNSAATLDRRQCVTVAAGSGAAYECGDLRLVHALPGFTVQGRRRQPVLLYNSQHAHPRPTVYADVALQSGVSAPQQVVATLTLPGGAVHQRTFRGSDWQPGTTRRIGVQWDGLSMPTGVYAYTLQVSSVYAEQTLSTSVSGEITIVNRSQSRFGAGWWLAGLEELVWLPDGARTLWIGGDGSTRVYSWVAQNTSVAATVDRPDTLRQVQSGGANYWYRRLPGGATVWFNAQGRQYQTQTPQGHATSFTYDGNGRLVGVYAPGGMSWWFNRDPSNGYLQNVCAFRDGPPCRFTGLVIDGTARVTGIVDPDNRWVYFGYDTDPANVRRVISRTDREGVVVSFGYDGAGKLASSGLTLADGTLIQNGYEAAEGKGVASAPTTTKISTAVAAAYTRLDGPRTDVDDHTYLWLTRWGAPRRIRDALGGETYLRRTDWRFPALVTEVVAPSGLRTLARYDSRGRVDSSTVISPLGDGRNATTTYAWDNLWNAPTRVTTPAGTTYTEYDPANGNRLWQQVGSDASRRVHFRYYATGITAGLLRAVQYPADAEGRVAVDSLAYDEVGNLQMTVSPLGFLTRHYRDRLGRDTLTVTPIDSASAVTTAGLLASGVRHRTTYDAMDRVTRTETVGPFIQQPAGEATFKPSNSPAETLIVENEYDKEGRLKWVERSASPDVTGVGIITTTYEYDRAGRKLSEHSTQSGETRFEYDPAGNVVVTRTPRLFQVRMQYDALGRLTQRKVPAVTYSRICDGSNLLRYNCVPFPFHPNNGTSLTLPEEWTFYRYDVAGNQVHAENADAIVRRSYLPSGALRTDSTYLRSVEGMDFVGTSYGLEYGYDLAGRVSSMRHPTNLATQSTQQLDSYGYDPVTGALISLQDRLGHHFGWNYDHASRLTSMRLPGQIADSMRYDRQGRLVWRLESGPTGTLHSETLRYDARNKLLWADNGTSSYQQWYSGLGMLVATDWQNQMNVARYSEEFRMDALGNMGWKRTQDEDYPPPEDTPYEFAYQQGAARMLHSRRMLPEVPSNLFYQDSTARQYDASGNVIHGYQATGGPGEDGITVITHEIETRSYYGADDRLRVFQELEPTRTGSHAGIITYKLSGVWEEYRYDPLGRRVMVRTNPGALCDVDQWTCTASTTRFVWAGDQLLWELKGGEGNSHPNAVGNVSYTHAGGMDRPLVITKNGTSIVTHQNWRGMFASGTYASGASSDCPPGVTSGCTPIAWPGTRTTAWGVGEKNPAIRNWFGGLVDGMRDASGQQYMRNRYYDPATGQFTQPDPIGLAGGLNAYGFADGDPITYSDPYGLAAQDGCDPPGSCFTKRVAQGLAVGLAGGTTAAGACVLASGGACLAGPAEGMVVSGTALGGAAGAVVGAGEELVSVVSSSRLGRSVRRWLGIGILTGGSWVTADDDGSASTHSPRGDSEPPAAEAQAKGRTARKQGEGQEPPRENESRRYNHRGTNFAP